MRAMYRRASLALLASLAVTLLLEDFGMAQTPRALPAGQLPADERLKDLKDLDGYFPFNAPAAKEAWLERAEKVRLQMRVALGLAEPERTP